jgi:N-acetylneuraminic acid mutarotase
MSSLRRAVRRTALAAALAAFLATAAVTAVGAADIGTWTTRAPSGFKRQEVTYQQSGGKMYLAGGRSDVQQVYDPGTNTWSNVASLPAPVPMDHIQTAAVNGKIYYIGGLTGWPGPSVGAVYVYDTATDTFSTGASMPTGRDRGAGGTAAYNGKIYVAGGLHNGTTVGWFDVYDTATNTWASLPDLPHRRDHFQGAIVNGRFWAIGGRVSSTPLRVGYNEAFDLTTQKWLTGFAPLPTLRGGVATAVFGNEIAVIGGEGGGSTFSTVEAYNTASNTWRTLASMPTARHGIQAAMLNGSAYIADGGTKQGGGAPTDVQEVLTVAAGYQPDAQIKLSSDASFVGNNVYNTTGAGQQRDVSSTDGGKQAFVVRVQNDGGGTDGFTFIGCGAPAGFTVRYFAGATGTTDITSAVVGGTYTVTGVAPGATRAVRLEVTTGASTSSGVTATCRTTTTSTSSTTVADAVLSTDTVS